MDGNNKGARRWRLLALCGCGLLVNVLGPALVGWLNLPLYLDNIGSALAAALGGYIPGIVVGFLTNLVKRHRELRDGVLRVADGADRHLLGLVRAAGVL